MTKRNQKQWRDDINERVQALRDQAAEEYVKSTDYCSHFTAVGLPNGFTQRFAEMIVEECVSQCWTVSEIEHKGHVISECSKRMRKHFGVE